MLEHRPARPQPAAPDGVHACTAVPFGGGVQEGELRHQIPTVRTGHRAQFTGDNDKGRLLYPAVVLMGHARVFLITTASLYTDV